MKVLIVEDELKISQFIAQTLKSMGHAADTALNAKDARSLFTEHEYDLIFLDIMLPDDSGFSLCKEMKQKKVAPPIMILTTLAQIEDKVNGLDSGADDYMTKPFSVDELQARTRALLRRNHRIPITLKCLDLELNLVTHQAIRGGETIKLTSKEYALLEYLLRNIGRPQSRTQIAQHVWDLHFDPESNVVDAYIKQLRKKIDSNFSKKLIKTIIGFGYVINDEE